jgi:hypothetical protein
LLHVSESVEFPEQAAPPPDGAGLLQNLIRAQVPPPQVLLHADQADQVPQTPSKEKLMQLSTILLYKSQCPTITWFFVRILTTEPLISILKTFHQLVNTHQNIYYSGIHLMGSRLIGSFG